MRRSEIMMFFPGKAERIQDEAQKESFTVIHWKLWTEKQIMLKYQVMLLKTCY